MARAIGVDLGSKRVGVASSDATRTLASPVTVLERRGNRAADHKALAAIIEEYEADVVIVGLPISLNGNESHAAKLVREEVAQMTAALPVPILLHDERFTTATAHASMMERKMKADARRRVVDKVAAAVMLQGWLDGQAYQRADAQRRADAAQEAEAAETASVAEARRVAQEAQAQQ